MQRKGRTKVISNYIMLEIIWEVTKKKKSKQDFKKEVHKEVEPREYNFM